MNTTIPAPGQDELAERLQAAVSAASPPVSRFVIPYALAVGALYAIFAVVQQRVHFGLNDLFTLSWIVQTLMGSALMVVLLYAPARWMAYRALLGQIAQWDADLFLKQRSWLQIQVVRLWKEALYTTWSPSREPAFFQVMGWTMLLGGSLACLALGLSVNILQLARLIPISLALLSASLPLVWLISFSKGSKAREFWDRAMFFASSPEGKELLARNAHPWKTPLRLRGLPVGFFVLGAATVALSLVNMKWSAYLEDTQAAQRFVQALSQPGSFEQQARAARGAEGTASLDGGKGVGVFQKAASAGSRFSFSADCRDVFIMEPGPQFKSYVLCGPGLTSQQIHRVKAWVKSAPVEDLRLLQLDVSLKSK
jgi:hypothetical protein